MSNEQESDNLQSDIINQILERQQQEQEEAVAKFAELCDQLAKSGITSVQLAYDGYGDSGMFNDVTAFVGEKECELSSNLKEELQDAGWSLLPGGWEINSGSFGELNINVADRRLIREHSWRVEDTEYVEDEYDL